MTGEIPVSGNKLVFQGSQQPVLISNNHYKKEHGDV